MKKDKGCTLTLPCLQVDEVTCQTCRYFGEPYCSNVALKDAMKRIKQLEAERDAAIKDIPRACVYCKHYISPPKIETHEHGVLVSYCEKDCYNISGISTCWEWRGYQPKEDNYD